MRVLGIDPGTRCCGYALVDSQGSHTRLVDLGVIRPPSGSIAMRLHHVGQSISSIIEKGEPDAAAVETSYWGRGAQSSLKIGQVRGVILAAVAAAGIEPVELAPAEVKKAVTGRGQAHKEQVEFMVKRILGLKGDIGPSDASDALALAIAALHRSGA